MTCSISVVPLHSLPFGSCGKVYLARISWNANAMLKKISCQFLLQIRFVYISKRTCRGNCKRGCEPTNSHLKQATHRSCLFCEVQQTLSVLPVIGDLCDHGCLVICRNAGCCVACMWMPIPVQLHDVNPS